MRACVGALLSIVGPCISIAHAQTSFKVAFWNIQSGKGEPAIAGHTAHFADTSNCTDPSQPMNAWAIDFVQEELRTKIRDDASIIALGLGEAWASTCASPTSVKNVLGWAAATESRNGTAVVARYGFAGTPQWQQLTNTDPQETMWVVRTAVYTNASHTQTIDLYTAHWFASSGGAATYDQQAQETVNFIQTSSGSGARVLIGDLNVWEGARTCGQDPQPAGLDRLRNADYVDAWPAVHGTAEGFTGMTNRQYGSTYCGNPPGYTWKRIDYGWSIGYTPTSMTRFGVPAVIGDDAPSDHYGIIVGYGAADTTPPSTSITAPAEGATVSSTINVSINASDDVGVNKVELLRDGAVIRTLTSPPYQTSWNTTAETNGAHQLRSRAFDAAGNSSVSAVRNVTVTNTTSGAGDIVLWTSRATVRAGDWQAVSDATAANSARLEDDDDGVPKVTTPAANPAHYFEMTFNAQAGVGYRLWMRGKAAADFYGNDSAYVQFDKSVDSSAIAKFRIGTTSATTYVLESCDACGVQGWGWEDNGWNGLGELIYFATSGTQTLRVQSREDGLGIDQIVLSPSQFLTSAPGPQKNDTTILAESDGGSSGTQSVVWTATVNAVPTNNSLQKTAGCGSCGDAGGVSQQSIDSGDGFVQFVPSFGHRLYAGLGTNRTNDTNFANINYAFNFWTNGTWDIRELGTYKAEGTFMAGDVFKVAVESGAVKYYQNDAVVYTSLVSPTYPLVLDTTLMSIGATVSNAAISTGAGGGAGGGGVPTSYQAATDTNPAPEPALPTLGAAGTSIVDPTFNSTIVRVTDGNTRPNALNRSFKTPSGTHQNAWNKTGTYFYVTASGGSTIPFAFDAATRTVSRIQPSGTGDGGLVFKFYIEPTFSYVNENLIYGACNNPCSPGADVVTIVQYDFASGQYSTLLDLKTVSANLAGTYVGGIGGSSGPTEKLAVFFGGTGQDHHYLVVVFDKNNPASRTLLDTHASTVDGQGTNVTLNFDLHHAFIDRSGRYVLLYPTSADMAAPRNASQVYVWDTQTNHFTELPASALSGGHDSPGFGTLVNKDCCRSSTWDAGQWQFRQLSTPLSSKDLIAPVLTPQEVYLSDHTTWNNAQPSTLVPVISALYRYGNNTAPWRPWDDEIVGIQTGAPDGTGATVWRFAHHRSDVNDDNDSSRIYFWYTPRPNVSQDGRWVLFTSNWEKSLGTDAAGEAGGSFRQDVFLVELKPGS
jgi:hypothetical protein